MNKYITKRLSKRELNDLEMIGVGAFAPLKGFMTDNEYRGVLENMRLPSGTLFPIPITLSITDEERILYETEKFIVLTDETGVHLGKLFIESIYPYDLREESIAVFGCYDLAHPYTSYQKTLLDKKRTYYVGGKIVFSREVKHYDFGNLRLTPKDTKAYFAKKGWKKIVAFQTRNPMHKSHFHLTLNSLKEVGDDAKLLLQPVVGETQDVDLDYRFRVRCYKQMLPYYPKNKVLLSLVPLSMRMAGPREALLHAIIRKNYGATHFIIGRDHAGPSYKRETGEPFYQPYDAQNLVERYADELGISIVTSKSISYVKSIDKYLTEDQITRDMTVLQLSGTKQREILQTGKTLPSWFTFPEVHNELRFAYRPRNEKGFVVYFLGIPASGKSTAANLLQAKLREIVRNRQVSVLDGDVIRLNISKGLGFSRIDRSINVQRIGYVVSEIVKHNGIAIVANIAPFEEDRVINRSLVQKQGDYIEIFVKTSLRSCIRRDPKGLYRKAKAGILKNLTGYNDTFETPKKADLVYNGESKNPESEVKKIMLEIEKRGLI